MVEKHATKGEGEVQVANVAGSWMTKKLAYENLEIREAGHSKYCLEFDTSVWH